MLLRVSSADFGTRLILAELLIFCIVPLILKVNNLRKDEIVKSQKINLLSFSDESESSTGENRNPFISLASGLRLGRHPGLRSGAE
jgi:hypothetical protein